ncbi:MAG TPA: YCF48-related protein, partial [Gemmatimonadales bacterium]|nr:YCF48-related protein [Gemmatimonadales bacterium]
DAGVQWRQAAAVPTRTTLTALHATDERTLWAVGHGGVVLSSVDAGEHWTLVAGRPDARDVLLSVRVEPDGHGLAVGAFGHALRTADGGAHWDRTELLPGEDGERHLNRLFVSAAGTWLIAAEGGVVLRGEERGGRWQAVQTSYAGSLWSGAALAGGVLLACGMRGHVARSTDDGRTWTHQAIAGAASLTAIAPFADGGCALAGVDGTLVLGAASGERFRLRPLSDRPTLTGLVALSSRDLVASTVAGMRRISMEV